MVNIKKFMYRGISLINIFFFVLIPLFSFSQGGGLTGIITTHDGHPASGVYIELKNNKKIAVSNDDGTFEFVKLKPGIDTLSISFVGLQKISKTVNISEEKVTFEKFVLRENETQLTEIIIAAAQSSNLRKTAIGKIPIQPMDLPQAVTTISRTEIENQQAQRLSDVVKNINGVYLGTSRAGTQETFFARGYSFSSTNMFKNGSRVNTGAMPEISSLDRVEVLKGGAAILYGNVAPGGILNMVTKKPKFDFGGEANIRFGSFGLIKPVIDVYGPINKKVAFRVNSTYEQAGSFRNNVTSEKYYVNPSFLIKAGKKTDIILEGDYLNHEFTPDFGIGSLNNTKIADVPRARFMGTAWQYNHVKQATTSATLRHEINSNWQYNAVVSWQLFDRDYFSVERIQANAAGDWARPLGRIDMQEKYLTAQFNLNGKFKTGKIEHLLLAGTDGDYYQSGSYSYDVQGKIYDTINILDPSKYVQRTDIPSANRISKLNSDMIRYGIFVQDLISISEKLKLLAGVRWSLQESPATHTDFLGKDSSVTGIARSANAFSPRLGVVYRIKPTISLFSSYSNSFFVNTGTDIYGNVLPPSIIDQYELGIKNIFFSGRLTVNVTGYRIINNNLAQTAEFDKNGNPNNDSKLKELTGQTTSDGVELDITAIPVKGLAIMAGYSYNNMRYTKTPDTKGSYVEGERLVTTPAHTANGTVFYTFQEGKFKNLKFGLSTFYTGKRFGGWNNTKGQAQNYSRLIPITAFSTIDISAGYAISKFSFLLKLSNLTNTYNYYVHENYSINPIAPRQWIGTLSYKF